MGLENARTWLFVPGDRSERFAKAAASGADVVIVDLEDAVDPASKASARLAVVQALEEGMALAVRVNAPDTDQFALDLDALMSTAARPQAVVVAKAEQAEALRRVAESLQCPVIPLIESARGLVASAELAGESGVVRLAFGAVDFSLDVGIEPAADTLAYARSHLVAISRAAAIAPPLDTPSLEIRDTAAISESAALARRFGMGGKLCIHPAQLAFVARAFAPKLADVRRARELLAASTGDGAASFEGRMIDRPVLEQARRVIAAAEVPA